MSTVWISMITAIGAFSVSGLSIYLGYKLFLAGATGGFKFEVKHGKVSVGLKSVASGISFSLFGMFIAIFALKVLIVS